MRLALRAAVASAALLTVSAAHATFDADFTGSTLRIDTIHTGTASEEHFSVHRTRIEGPWPGSRTQLIDTANLGKYMLEVVDLQDNRLLYSRGFASIFGEWETTGEAREQWGALEEAYRIPEPKRPFQLRVRKRQGDQSFREVWATTIDPTSRFVDRSPVADYEVWAVLESGDPATKVDYVVLGDGYTEAEMDKFRQQATELSMRLFDVEPFKSRKGDFNIWAVASPSPESGISRPRAGIFRESALGARYNTFDSERYILTLEDRRWRDIAAAAPYDFVLILVNERKYGGGGIYGLYSTAAAGSAYADYLVVHEFGHHFAGLGDEYFTSSVAYEDFAGHVEPWEPNITALGDPENIKWRHLMEDDTPLPTPWEKEKYETRSRANQEQRRKLRAAGAAEEELEALFDEEKAYFTRTLGQEKYAGKIGAFEGAMYESQGLYRPSVDCLMFTRNVVGLCQVCQEATSKVIDLYTR